MTRIKPFVKITLFLLLILQVAVLSAATPAAKPDWVVNGVSSDETTLWASGSAKLKTSATSRIGADQTAQLDMQEEIRTCLRNLATEETEGMIAPEAYTKYLAKHEESLVEFICESALISSRWTAEDGTYWALAKLNRNNIPTLVKIHMDKEVVSLYNSYQAADSQYLSFLVEMEKLIAEAKAVCDNQKKDLLEEIVLYDSDAVAAYLQKQVKTKQAN